MLGQKDAEEKRRQPLLWAQMLAQRHQEAMTAAFHLSCLLYFGWSTEHYMLASSYLRSAGEGLSPLTPEELRALELPERTAKTLEAEIAAQAAQRRAQDMILKASRRLARVHHYQLSAAAAAGALLSALVVLILRGCG